MYHHVNFAKRLCLLSLENQSDYHWFVLLHNCLNYNKLPSLFLESSCVYGLRSTDSNIYSVPKIMRTCSAGGFPYAALFLWENPPSTTGKAVSLQKSVCTRPSGTVQAFLGQQCWCWGNSRFLGEIRICSAAGCFGEWGPDVGTEPLQSGGGLG